MWQQLRGRNRRIWGTWPKRCARASACVRSAGVQASSTNSTVLAACSVIPACAQQTHRLYQPHQRHPIARMHCKFGFLWLLS